MKKIPLLILVTLFLNCSCVSENDKLAENVSDYVQAFGCFNHTSNEWYDLSFSYLWYGKDMINKGDENEVKEREFNTFEIDFKSSINGYIAVYAPYNRFYDEYDFGNKNSICYCSDMSNSSTDIICGRGVYQRHTIPSEKASEKWYRYDKLEDIPVVDSYDNSLLIVASYRKLHVVRNLTNKKKLDYYMTMINREVVKKNGDGIIPYKFDYAPVTMQILTSRFADYQGKKIIPLRVDEDTKNPSDEYVWSDFIQYVGQYAEKNCYSDIIEENGNEYYSLPYKVLNKSGDGICNLLDSTSEEIPSQFDCLSYDTEIFKEAFLTEYKTENNVTFALFDRKSIDTKFFG